jgi:hypothetical protein
MNKIASILLFVAIVSAFDAFADPVAEPKTAEIVDIPAKFADSRTPPGNVKITFTDGHTETLTHEGNCMEPRVLAGGIVGWTHFTALDQRGSLLNNTLQLRFPDGRTKEFKPNHEAPFIMDWGLADQGSSVVIVSMQHHGHPYFIRYDLKSGRITGTVNIYLPYDKLPPWAQPLSDEKP